MPSQKVRVIVEFPAGMQKLSKKQTANLKKAFSTEFANTIGAEAGTVAGLEFDNVTTPPVGGTKASKKSAKKSSKKR